MKLMNLKGIKTFIAIASMLCACGTEVTVNEVIYAEDDVAKPDSYRNDVQQEEENKLVFPSLPASQAVLQRTGILSFMKAKLTPSEMQEAVRILNDTTKIEE
jgi:hypothetical protein